jgi:hypothetical protein
MSDELLAAYRGTRYAVIDVDGGTLAEARVEQHCPDVDAVLTAHGAASGVFITAWNPRSVPTDDQTNAEAHAQLAAVLDGRGWTALPHAGFGEDPDWRPEHGFFVLDLPEAEALRIAVEFEQNAVVVVRRGAPAQLVLSDVMTS